MLNITLREHNNGYSVYGFSDEEGMYVFDEVAESRLDALEVLRNWLAEEFEIEREKITCN